uniref:Pco085865 n=1 Tax=Arundo donax TaxID=35708 RepID=A0A0A9FZX7_ARUDO
MSYCLYQLNITVSVPELLRCFRCQNLVCLLDTEPVKKKFKFLHHKTCICQSITNMLALSLWVCNYVKVYQPGLVVSRLHCW